MLFTAEDIAEYISINHNIPKYKCLDIVKDVFRFISFALTNGHCIRAIGLGMFKFKTVAERKYNNKFSTNFCPRHSTPIFKFYPSIKEDIKNKTVDNPYKNK